MNKYTRWLIRLIGPLLLIFFLWRSDPRVLLAGLGSVELGPLILSLALFPVFIVVKAWRWNVIMAELGMQPPSLAFSSALYSIGLFAGGVTPGQSGDFIKGWYLRERGQPLPTALFSIVLDRLFDFAVMALLALLGLVLFIDLFPADMQAPLRYGTLGFAAAIFLITPALIARRPREWLIARVLPILPAGLRAALERMREQFSALNLRPVPLAKLVLASAGSATSTIVRIYLLYVAMSLTGVPLLAIIGSTALIAILQALPISFAGVGVRDAVLIVLLQHYGYGQEQAIILSALFLLVNLEHILLGFLVSLRYPLGSAMPQAGVE